MKRIKTRWVRGVGAVVLVGGLIVTGWGLGVTSAAPPENPGNPFQAILDKLDQIQAAITGGGGGGEGNHTLRWDTVQPAATRFVILPAFNSAAVLDKNTGLVWESLRGMSSRIMPRPAGFAVTKSLGGRRAGGCRPFQSWPV